MISPRRFLSSRQNILGLTIVAFFFFLALAAPRLSPPQDPDAPSPFKVVGRTFDRQPNPPGPEYVLGTAPRRADINLPGIGPEQSASSQMDIYHTLIWGSRSALQFGLVVALTAAAFGVFIGLVSGYAGGWLNGLLMRVTDAFLTFPPIAAVWLIERAIFSRLGIDFFIPPPDPTLGLQLVALLGLTPIMITLIVFTWMPYARIVNSLVIQLKGADYVIAAQAMGATPLHTIVRHLLPNAVAPAIVLMARDIGAVVILETAFTFIGLRGTVAWGLILVSSRDYVIGFGGNPFTYWWTFLPVALAIILFGIGWNLLGDGLNTMLNPRTRR
jgi:peptide/nickel transport system permease protein